MEEEDAYETTAPRLAPLPSRAVRVLKQRGPLQFVRFTKCGRYCVSGGQDRTLVLWNPFRVDPADGSNGLALKSYEGHGYEVTEAAVSDGNDRLVSVGGDKCAFVWDVSRGACVRRVFGHEQRLTSCALNREATLLLTASNDRTVRAWDLRGSSRAAVQTLTDFTDNVTRVVLSADDGAIFASCMDGHLRRYDARSARVYDDDIGAAAVSCALSRDGHVALAATFVGGGALQLLDLRSGALLKRYVGHANSLYRCAPAFAADDAHVACGGEDGGVTLWDLVSAAPALVLPAAHKRVVSWVDIHPEPATPAMLTASYDGTAKLWIAPGCEAALAVEEAS